MKNILAILILVLTFAFAIAAQTNQDSSCPTVSVSGGGMPGPKDPMSFTANVDTKGKDLTLEYIWTVSSGKIASGQGTTSISVKRDADENVTATIEIKGFPEGCPNTFSESPIWDPPPKAVKIGEISNFVTPTEKKQLEQLKNKIINDPNAQIYVIGRFKKNTSEKRIAQTLKKIGSFLMKEFVLGADRITMVTVFGEREYSEIWIVPPGANNPQVR